MTWIAEKQKIAGMGRIDGLLITRNISPSEDPGTGAGFWKKTGEGALKIGAKNLLSIMGLIGAEFQAAFHLGALCDRPVN